MARIAIAGFQHETNTFAPIKASYRDFEIADGWPGLTRGPAIFDIFRAMNLPLVGFLDCARSLGHEFAPLLWCSASPSAEVEKTAYERVAAELIAGLKQAGAIDALYLDLHGAMVAEHLEDGEGELLTRLRRLCGPDLPIVVSLDLHANVTAAMMREASALVICRTYPHVDLAETGERAAGLLDRILRRGPLAKAMRRADFLVPLTWQCTLVEPAASLYREVAALESEGRVASASLAFGFPPADIAECGPAAVAYDADEVRAVAAADQILSSFRAAEPDFAGKVWSKDEAVQEAMRLSARADRPIILVDTQDNPGAGGTSDSVDLLEALLRLGAEGAVFANLCDSAAAAIAHRAGIGAEINIALGAASGPPLRPLSGTYEVLALGDGHFAATGPFYRGNVMQLGPMALLRAGGTKIVLTSRKQQCADRAMLRHLGLAPESERILALKSSVHFRADFQEIAADILIVAAEGANPVDHRVLPYRRLRPGLRLMPDARRSTNL